MTQKQLSFFTRSSLLAPAVLATFALASGVAEAQQPSPTLMEAGVWVNDVGDGAVELYVCQDKASRLCGRIVWLKEPLNAEGVPKRDRYNPKAEMQNRPICGLPVLGNLARDSEGGFDSGWIYDPKAGKSYSAAVRISARDKLTVTGYLGMKFMGKSFTWTRAPADLPRCDGTPPVQPISTGAKPAAKPPAAKPVTGGASAAALPSKPKQPTTSAAAAGTAKKPATSTTAKAAAHKPSTPSKAATTAVNVPKPKPAQKPVKAVANSNAAQPAPATPQPAAKPAPKPVIEADDTATSWSGQ